MRAGWVGVSLLVVGCFGEPAPTSVESTTGTGAGSTDTSSTEGTVAATGASESDVGEVDDTSAASSTSEGAGSSSDGEPDTTGSPVEEVLILSLHDALCDAEIVSYQNPDCGNGCSAAVECNARTMEAGHAIALGRAQLEDGVTHDRVVELATYSTATGIISAEFDGLSLAGASAPRFRATAWCGAAELCEVRWQVEAGTGGIPAEASAVEIVDGQGATIDLDLTRFIGEALRVTLRMSNHGTFDQGDRIRFADPRLVDLR